MKSKHVKTAEMYGQQFEFSPNGKLTRFKDNNGNSPEIRCYDSLGRRILKLEIHLQKDTLIERHYHWISSTHYKVIGVNRFKNDPSKRHERFEQDFYFDSKSSSWISKVTETGIDSLGETIYINEYMDVTEVRNNRFTKETFVSKKFEFQVMSYVYDSLSIQHFFKPNGRLLKSITYHRSPSYDRIFAYGDKNAVNVSIDTIQLKGGKYLENRYIDGKVLLKNKVLLHAPDETAYNLLDQQTLSSPNEPAHYLRDALEQKFLKITSTYK